MQYIVNELNSVAYFNILSLARRDIKYGRILPYLQAVPIGGTISLNCSSSSPPIWSHNLRTNIVPYLDIVRTYIYISHVTEDNGGYYFCKGTYPNGTFFETESFVYVGCELFKYKLN